MATAEIGVGSDPWAFSAPRTLIMTDTLTSMLRSCPQPLLMYDLLTGLPRSGPPPPLTGLPRSVCLSLNLVLLPPGVSQSARPRIVPPHLRMGRTSQNLHHGGRTLCPLKRSSATHRSDRSGGSRSTRRRKVFSSPIAKAVVDAPTDKHREEFPQLSSPGVTPPASGGQATGKTGSTFVN